MSPTSCFSYIIAKDIMFSFAIILAFASTAFELMIAAKIPAWRRWSHNSLIFNLANSMLLSYLVGIMFGATGLIAMTAGIFSTILTIPGYKILHLIYDSDHAIKHGGNLIEHYKTTTTNMINKWTQPLKDLFNLIYKIIRIITFPIWFTRNCINKYNNYRNRHIRTT